MSSRSSNTVRARRPSKDAERPTVYWLERLTGSRFRAVVAPFVEVFRAFAAAEGDRDPGLARPMALLAGGLDTVQASSVVTALPLIPVLGILAMSLFRWLRADDSTD